MADPQTRDFAARIARMAFDAGQQAAGQPRGEIDRRRVTTQGIVQDMLGSHIEAEVERRIAAAGGAS